VAGAVEVEESVEEEASSSTSIPPLVSWAEADTLAVVEFTRKPIEGRKDIPGDFFVFPMPRHRRRIVRFAMGCHPAMRVLFLCLLAACVAFDTSAAIKVPRFWRAAYAWSRLIPLRRGRRRIRC